MRNRFWISFSAALLSASACAFAEPLEPTEDEAAILEAVTWYWILCGSGGIGEDVQNDSAEPDTLMDHFSRGFEEYIRNFTETHISKHVRSQMANDHEHIRALFGSPRDEEFGITIKPSALKIAYPANYDGGALRNGTIDCMTGLTEEESQEMRDTWGVFELRSTQIESLPFPVAWMRFDFAFTPEEFPYTNPIESSPQVFRQRRWLSLVKRGKWKITDDFRGAIPPAAKNDEIFQPITIAQNARPSKLERLNWVYESEGVVAVELPGGREALEKYFNETNTPHPVAPPQHFKLPPNHPMNERALALVKPNLGDSYCVIPAGRTEVESLSLTGAGNGGVTGFVGILEEPAEPVESKWFRPIGIALQHEDCEFETEELSIPEDAHDSLKTFARDELLADRLNRVVPFYIDRPNRLGALLNLTFADRDVLIGAFQNAEGAWKSIPFPAPVVPDPNGFVLENPEGENDVAPHDSAVYMMPDIDHNGTNEIFIQSTVSFLFTLTFNETGAPNGFKTVNSAYVGP